MPLDPCAGDSLDRELTPEMSNLSDVSSEAGVMPGVFAAMLLRLTKRTWLCSRECSMMQVAAHEPVNFS